MLQSYQLPIKGTFYYAAEIALDENLLNDKTVLELRPEPENPYDRYALQIFLPLPQPPLDKRPSSLDALNTDYRGLLLGYVPRQLAPILSHQLKSACTYNLQVIHKAKFGNSIEIECLLKIQLPWFTALNMRLMTLWIRQLIRLKRLRDYLTQTHK